MPHKHPLPCRYRRSKYVRDLIRKDQKRHDKLKLLQQEITKGFASGEDGRLDIAEIKRLAKKQSGLNAN